MGPNKSAILRWPLLPAQPAPAVHHIRGLACLNDGDGCCNYDHHKDNGNNHYKFILYERVVEREGGAPTYAEKHSACGVQLLFDINIEFYERKRQTFHKENLILPYFRRILMMVIICRGLALLPDEISQVANNSNSSSRFPEDFSVFACFVNIAKGTTDPGVDCSNQ